MAFRWELDLFGRAAAAQTAGDAAVDAATAQSVATRLAITTSIADALYQARAAKARLSDAEAILAVYQGLLTDAEARLEAGLGLRADVDRARAMISSQRAAVTHLSFEAENTKRRLLLLIRQHDEDANAFEIKGDTDCHFSVPDALPPDLLSRRPDVRAAEHRMRIQAARLRSADLELLPRIALQPGGSFLFLDAPRRSSSFAMALGGSLTLPLFDRPRLIGAVREQGAFAESAVIDYERAVDNALSEADRALLKLRAELSRAEDLRVSEQLSSDRFYAARRLYAIRVLDFQTLLHSEQAWREARIASTDGKFELARSAVDLVRALGGDWFPVCRSGMTGIP